jgi:hypothetical protein
MAKLIEHKKSPAVRTWLKKEIAEQKARYKAIAKEMDDLGPKRDKWVEEFFHRIQTRGFNVHFNMRRQVQAEELPKKPRRKFKVVF